MKVIESVHNLYLGNKMLGKGEFNQNWFDNAESVLRTIPTVFGVFNPARRDRENGIKLNGTAGELHEVGQQMRRSCLRADWNWIAEQSTGMIAGPDWQDSPGTISEIACHQALYLPVWEYEVFVRLWHHSYLNQLVLPKLLEFGGATVEAGDVPAPPIDLGDGLTYGCPC